MPEEGLDELQRRLVEHEIHAGQLCQGFASQVVERRTEAAGGDDDVWTDQEDEPGEAQCAEGEAEGRVLVRVRVDVERRRGDLATLEERVEFARTRFPAATGTTDS